MPMSAKCPECGHKGTLDTFVSGSGVDDEMHEDAAGTQEPPGMETEGEERTPGAFLRKVRDQRR